jgi:hypothetical protein
VDLESKDPGATDDLNSALPDLELQSAGDRGSASFQQWAETYFYSQKDFTKHEEDVRRRYRHHRTKVFEAFEAAEGPITASYYCYYLVAAAVKTSKPIPPLFGRFKRPAQPTLHIMNNLMESHIEDLEILELTKLLYGCQDIGRRVNELLVGGQREMLVNATFDVASDVLSILDARKGARQEPIKPKANPGGAGEAMRSKGEEGQPEDSVSETATLNPIPVTTTKQTKPSLQEPSAIELQKTAFANLQAMFERAARRQGQLTYMFGVLLGAVAVSILGMLLALFLPRGRLAGVDIPNMIGAFVGGAVGALVSVMTRLGNAAIRYEVGRTWLRILGALRPLIGSMFGLAFFALASVGILPVKILSPEFLFFAGLGFIAGFNERWAQGVVVRSGAGVIQEEGSA